MKHWKALQISEEGKKKLESMNENGKHMTKQQKECVERYRKLLEKHSEYWWYNDEDFEAQDTHLDVMVYAMDRQVY